MLTDLRDIGEVSASRLRRERFTRHIVERVLTQLVDIANAINTHIAAAELDRAPHTNRSSFEDISQAGVISYELAKEIGPSVGMRNVLIHEYLDIDFDVVAEAVPMAVDQYGRYVESVARWLDQKVSGGT